MTRLYEKVERFVEKEYNRAMKELDKL